eukprot:3830-Rhodomonas_salina.1
MAVGGQGSVALAVFGDGEVSNVQHGRHRREDALLALRVEPDEVQSLLPDRERGTVRTSGIRLSVQQLSHAHPRRSSTQPPVHPHTRHRASNRRQHRDTARQGRAQEDGATCLVRSKLGASSIPLAVMHVLVKLNTDASARPRSCSIFCDELAPHTCARHTRVTRHSTPCAGLTTALRARTNTEFNARRTRHVRSLVKSANTGSSSSWQIGRRPGRRCGSCARRRSGS